MGGSAAFRRFLLEELVPAIDARYRTTRERSLIGESLAGLFVVETFLTEFHTGPAPFRHYLAFDPSVWWNGGALIDTAGARRSCAPSLGGEAPPRAAVRQGAARRTLDLASSRDDVDDGTARLVAGRRRRRCAAVIIRFTPRPDRNHATIFRAAAPAALARALR